MEAMDEIAGYVSESTDTPQQTTSSSMSSPLPVRATAQAATARETERDTDGDEETKSSCGASPLPPRAIKSVPVSFSSSSTSTSSAAQQRTRIDPPTARAPLTHKNKPVTQTESDAPAAAVNTLKYKFIPMRLSVEERSMLNVLLSALEVCEYTDVVDVTFSHTRKNKYSRIIESLVDILSICSGLMLASNLNKGEQLVSGKSLNDNVPFFRDLFEIGRRYKIMNPAKMRSTYGKLMYILMDTESPQVKSQLQLSFVKPILSVDLFLTERDAKGALGDPLWLEAAGVRARGAAEDDECESRREVALRAQRKKDALELLCKTYSSDKLSASDIQRVVDSIADNASYMAFNATPVRKMLSLLTQHFDPQSPQEPFSLNLTTAPRKRNSSSSFFSSLSGYSSSYLGSGACLSHSHATQYHFVLQSLTLWEEIMRHMPRLWMLADADMTCEAYRLVDTGQGYQRLQSCPRVRKEMTRILSLVQGRVGKWVGLSVVHLGDRDVPNALVFIDKYTQVSRILSPIVQCVEQLPSLVDDAAFHAYITSEWGSIHTLRMQLLSDFFKHGFDGSGDDGGSCIDGRLTSAWNWCAKLNKKPYHGVFLFAGFQGFDGDFKDGL